MRIGKWAGIFIVVVIFIYAGWVLVAINRTPTIAVDYVALLNEKAKAVPENQRAWALYRTAGIALRKTPEPRHFSEDMYDDTDTPMWPDQEGWNYYETWIVSHSQTLETLYAAVAMDGMGFILAGTVAEEDKELWPEKYAAQHGIEQPEGFVVSVLMPQLGPMRGMARLLSIDAKNAAVNGNSERCQSDIESMLTIGMHVREHPLLISDLVSFSVYNMAFSTLREIMDHNRTLFSTAQLDELARALKELDSNLNIRFDGERMFVLDLLQRMYTDDGNGDGRIIPIEGVKMLSQLEVTTGFTSSSLIPALVAPIADMCFASRKETIVEYDRRLAYYEEQQKAAFAEVSEDYLFVGLSWTPATSPIDPFYLIELLAMSTYDNAINHAVKTKESRDALLEKIVSQKLPQ